MIIFPAIDIQDGKVIRLQQGQFDRVSTYSKDPVSIARKWVDAGAQWLHVVDLDGAQSGQIKNFDIIAEIAKSAGVPMQMGGGIRSLEDISRLLKSGIKRVVLATRALEDKTFLKTVLREWPENIAVSVDCVNGFVTQKGWTEVMPLFGKAFARQLEQEGLRYLIYTDIGRDGMLTGPNLDDLQEILKSVSLSVISSGGVSNMDDIKNLVALKAKNLIGVITGKAIYEGTLDLKQAIQLCSQNG